MNTLTFETAQRAAENLRGGGTRTGRRYADLVVDGIPLGPRMRQVQDLISRVGWGPEPYRQEALEVLLLEREGDLPGDRRALYVCPECGDTACGAVTVVIERQGDQVVWRDFQYETEIDLSHTLGPLQGLGPFTFDWLRYEEALRAAVAGAAPDTFAPKKPWWRHRVR